MMIILIHYARENGIDLYVGFMDYEKAYDYANRANIISDLMKDGCSSAMVRALTKMLTTSTYCPKSSKNCVSEGIETDYGVTQGRCSCLKYISSHSLILNSKIFTLLVSTL